MTLPTQTGFGEPLVKSDQLARQLGMTRRWVYEMVEEQGLPCFRIGRALLFEVGAVRGWLDQHRAGRWPETER